MTDKQHKELSNKYNYILVYNNGKKIIINLDRLNYIRRFLEMGFKGYLFSDFLKQQNND